MITKSLITLVLTASAAFATEATEILGTWATADGTMIIRFRPTGETYAATFVYGALVVETDGKTFKKDLHNPDPALRDRSLGEVDFISGLSWDAADARWEGGTIYQAATGGTGSAQVTLVDGRMDLRAYRGTPLIGRTFSFTRQAD